MRQAAGCLLALMPVVLVQWAVASVIGWGLMLFWDGVAAVMVGMFSLGTYLLRDEEPKTANDNSTAHTNTPEAK